MAETSRDAVPTHHHYAEWLTLGGGHPSGNARVKMPFSFSLLKAMVREDILLP